METLICNIICVVLGLLYCAYFFMWFFILKGYKPFENAPKSKLYRYSPLFAVAVFAVLVAFLFSFDAPLKWRTSVIALWLVPILTANVRCFDLILWCKNENVAAQSKEGRTLCGLRRRCRDICWLSVLIYSCSIAFLLCIR